jgi:hypothetical protein
MMLATCTLAVFSLNEERLGDLSVCLALRDQDEHLALQAFVHLLRRYEDLMPDQLGPGLVLALSL